MSHSRRLNELLNLTKAVHELRSATSPLRGAGGIAISWKKYPSDKNSRELESPVVDGCLPKSHFNHRGRRIWLNNN